MIDYISFYSEHVEGLKKAGKSYQGWCPFHSDKGSKRMGFALNPDDGLWYCFSCGKGGNALTFCKEKGIPPTEAPDYDPSFFKYSYRGGKTKKKHRTEKTFFWEGTEGSGPGEPFNPMAIDLAKERKQTLWICEGEKDCLTMTEAGELAIAIPSATAWKVLSGVSFTGIPDVIVAMDHDKAGEKAREGILALFPFASAIEWPEDKPEGFDVTNQKEIGPNFVETLKGWAKFSDSDPYPSLYTSLSAKFERDQAREPGKLLGYRLEAFPRLAENIDGVQPGFIVIGAETNAGKTNLLVNLTLDLLNSNEDLAGIFFTLDDSKDVILNRFLGIITGIPLNQVQRPQAQERRKKMQDDGYEKLYTLGREGRLFLRDAAEIQNVMDLETEIRRRSNKKLFVVIDAIYNLDVGEDVSEQGPRPMNIERANRLKALANAFDIPVICSGEFRKRSRDEKKPDRPPILDDLMETGKFAYNASLALLLYPEKWDDYNREDKPTMNLAFAKNKMSYFRGIQKLQFERITGRMTEVEG